MAIEKIVSHLPPRHLDDFLAISILKYLYPDATIEYLHPQSVPLEYLKNSEIALVDIGNSYNPDLNNFDHHQNLDISSSIILVLRKFFPDISISNAVNVIDTIDRFGFPKAEAENLVKKDYSISKKIKVILRTEISEEVGRIVLDLLSRDLDYSTFIERLYEELKLKGLTKKAEEEIEKEEKLYEEKIKEVEYLDLDYTGKTLKIAISNESLSPFHGRFFEENLVDILVERNSMSKENTSIIVNSSSKNIEVAMDFADNILAKNFTIIFKHKTGSIRVVSENVKVVRNYIKNNFKL